MELSTLLMVRAFFGWGFLINTGIVLVWFLLYTFCKPWLSLFNKMFNLSDAVVPTIHYCGIALYKLLNMVFFLTPFLVLTIFFL